MRRLAEAGAAVVLTGRGREALERVEAQVSAVGGKAVAVQADIGRIEDSQKVIALAVERFGRIDILVNNASVFPPCVAMEMTESVWDQTFDTDLRGAFFAAKLAAHAMIAAGHGGRIINVLSTAAFRIASPLVAYGAAKAGLWYVTQALAQELAEHQILVNAVTPGATMTAERLTAMNDGTFVEHALGSSAPEALKRVEGVLKNNDIAKMLARLTPLGRPGYPDDIADAVLFLASDMAKYINGVNITVDGGQSLPSMEFGAHAEDADTDSKPGTGSLNKSLEGTFKATVKTPMGAQEVVFAYHVEGAALAGTVTVAGEKVEVEQGRATEDGFAHQYRFRTIIGSVRVQVAGRLDGDRILGTLKTPLGSIPFEATRV